MPGFFLGRLGINAGLEELGLTAEGALDSPKDELGSVGWYPAYGRPGHAGNTIFSGYVYFQDKPGPLVALKDTARGDRIRVSLGPGEAFDYDVVSLTRYPLATIPMGPIIFAPERPEAEEWITVMTAAGELDANGNYDSMDVVVAKRVP